MTDTPSVNVLCGFELLAEAIADSLTHRNVAASLIHPVDIVFDADWGFALKASLDDARPSIIITDNACPEYWEVLWDRGVTALVARNDFTMNDLVTLILRADKQFESGKRIKDTPYHKSELTKRERAVFLASVQNPSMNNARIAQTLYLSEQTVHNHLHAIYAKLGVKNRIQLLLYYWGGLPTD